MTLDTHSNDTRFGSLDIQSACCSVVQTVEVVCESFVLVKDCYLIYPKNLNDLQNNDIMQIECRIFFKSEAIFHEPMDSRTLGIFKTEKDTFVIKNIPKTLLKTQCVCISMDEYLCVLPLRHTL